MRNRKWWNQTGANRAKAVIMAGVLATSCAGMSVAALAEDETTISSEAEDAETKEDAAKETTEETTEETKTDEEVSEDETEEKTEEKQVSKVDSTTSGEEAGFEMSTKYPGVTAKAGDSVTFDLDFSSLTGNSYDLALTEDALPDGWSGYFTGNSNEISRIHIDSKSADADSALAKFNLTIPEEVNEGTNTITLLAVPQDGGIAYALNIDVTIADTENGEGSFTTEYPSQQAAAGTAFSFEGTIVNNRATAQSYALSAQADAGWQVGFTPSGESSQVASINVDPGSSQGVTIAVTPPETIKEGEYTIPCTAVSADETLNLELTVTITGSYEVALSTPSGNLSVDAYANKEKKVTLSVTNNGNTDLENLNLTSKAPTDWEVSFDNSTIDKLEAGATKEVTATIKPNSDSITGDYVTEITVANEAATSTAQLRVAVKTRTTWGIVAIVVIVALVGCVSAVFKKYGRR